LRPVSSRHVTRLSAIYALLGGSRGLIQAEHVRSAASFWEVALASAEIVFRGRTGNDAADRILEAMSPGEELTLTQLREGVFKGHIRSARLREAAELLERIGGFVLVPESTRGRPREVLRRLTQEEASKRRGQSSHGAKQEEKATFSGSSTFSGRVAP
jgi:hypothetical protein